MKVIDDTEFERTWGFHFGSNIVQTGSCPVTHMYELFSVHLYLLFFSPSFLPVKFCILEMCLKKKKQETCLELFRSDLSNRCKSSLMACILENAVAIVEKIVENMRYAVFILWICYGPSFTVAHNAWMKGPPRSSLIFFYYFGAKRCKARKADEKPFFSSHFFFLFSFRNP